MRITVDTEGKRIRLIFPTSIIISRLGLKVLESQIVKGRAKAAELQTADEAKETSTLPIKAASASPLAGIDTRALRKMRAGIREWRKSHRGVPFVEVSSADGSYVKIIL